MSESVRQHGGKHHAEQGRSNLVSLLYSVSDGEQLQVFSLVSYFCIHAFMGLPNHRI